MRVCGVVRVYSRVTSGPISATSPRYNGFMILDRIAQARLNPTAPESQELKQKFESALSDQLVDSVGGMVEGWSTPHVEKPSFPFVVDKQAARFSPEAVAQARRNMANVL